MTLPAHSKSVAGTSTTADEVNNLDAIAFVQNGPRPFITTSDGTI